MTNKILNDIRIDRRIKDVFGQLEFDSVQPSGFKSREEIMEFEKTDDSIAGKEIMELINNSDHYKEIIPSAGLVTSTKEFKSNPDGNKIKIQYIRPDTDETLSCVYYIHGGGMEMSGKQQGVRCGVWSIRAWTEQTDCVVTRLSNVFILNFNGY